MIKHLFAIALFSTSLFESYSFAEKTKNIWMQSYALEAKGEYAEAENVLQPMLGEKIKVKARELALLRLGWLNYLQKDYSDSINYYVAAIKLNQQSFQAKLGILLPLQAQERWSECELYAKKIIDDSQWDYDAHVNLMYCQQASLKWNQLEKHAQSIVTRYPTNVMPYLYLARAQRQIGKEKEVEETYMNVLRLSPTNAEAIDYFRK